MNQFYTFLHCTPDMMLCWGSSWLRNHFKDNRRCNDLAGGIKVVGGSSRCIKTEPPPPGRTAACQLFQYLYVLTAADSRPAQASTMGLLKPA